MKNILMTLALLGAAAYAAAAPPAPDSGDPARDRDRAAPADRDRAVPPAPAADEGRTTDDGKVKAKTEPVPGLSKYIDDVEVVSSDPIAKQITVKIRGDEETLPVPAKLTAALNVVKAGDRVRLYFEQADPEGRPRQVEGLVITKANHDLDHGQSPSETKDRSSRDDKSTH